MDTYEVWKTGILDDEPREKVAIFYSMLDAVNYIDWQAEMAQSCVLVHHGTVVPI